MKLSPIEIKIGLALMEMIKAQFPQFLEDDDYDAPINGADLVDSIALVVKNVRGAE